MAASTACSTWLGGLALAIAMVAGTSCAPPYPSCRHDKHCKVQEGERCVADVCHECKSDGDCKDEGRPICDEFRCVEEYVPTQEPPPSAERSPAPCVDRADCEPSRVCDEGMCGPCRDDLACSPEVCDLDAGRCVSPSPAPLENALGGALTPEYQAWVLARWQIALQGNQRPEAYAPCRAGRHCRLRWDVDWQLFERDSSVVRPDPSLATMLAEGLSDDPSARLVLVGHASVEETDVDTLAVIRAERVRAWLVSEGLDANRMSVKAEGTSRPVYVRSKKHSGAADRRVEFLLSSDASSVGWWPPGTKAGRGAKPARGTKPKPTPEPQPKPTPEPEPKSEPKPEPGPAPAPSVAPTATPDAPLPAFPPAPAPAG